MKKVRMILFATIMLFIGSNCTSAAVCTASKKLTNAGVGKIATKGHEFDIGTEYQCDPGDGKVRTFYVISTITGKVKMIADRNLGDNRVAWVKESDFYEAGGTSEDWKSAPASKGPVTAEKYLKSKTSNWKNVTVSFPTVADIMAVNKNAFGSDVPKRMLNKILWTNLAEMKIKTLSFSDFDLNDCTNCNVNTSIPSYWLNYQYGNTSTIAIVRFNYINKSIGAMPFVTQNLSLNGRAGVRPVITVAKIKISTK